MDQNCLIFEAPPKPMIFFILGGPGSGKGTLCEQLVKKLGFHHFSTGDLLRQELTQNQESEISQSIKTLMSEGKLVSSDLLLDLVSEKIKELKKPNVRILLDGFPRNEENVEIWKKKGLDQNFDVKMAFFLDCCFETMESNILERSKSSGRDDDNIETIRKRIETFELHTKPLVDIFAREHKIFVVDAEKSPENIFEVVVEKLKELNVLGV